MSEQSPPTPSSTDDLVERFNRQIAIALKYAADEKPQHEKLLPSVFELQVGHLKDIGAELASTLAAMQGKLEEAIRTFATAILHGDDEHREWLTAAAEAFIAGTPLPPPNGKGRAEAAEARLTVLEAELERFAGLEAESMEAAEVVGELKARALVLEAEIARLNSNNERLVKELMSHQADLRSTLASVLYHFGPEGTAKVTTDALKARPSFVPADNSETRSALQEPHS